MGLLDVKLQDIKGSENDIFNLLLGNGFSKRFWVHVSLKFIIQTTCMKVIPFKQLHVTKSKLIYLRPGLSGVHFF
jgi:hypothetical protein